MTEIHPAALAEDQLLAVCRLRPVRGSGPGGQHRNKVSTGVVLEHTPTGTRVAAMESRNQPQNRAVAIQRLRWQLAVLVRVPPASDRVDLLRRYVQAGRLRIATDNPDLPAVAALILDAAAADPQADLAGLAVQAGTSATQLSRLLAAHRPAFLELNRLRRERGLPPLK